MINMSDQHIDPIHFSVNTIGWKIYNELTIDVRQLNSHWLEGLRTCYNRY